MKIYKLIIYGFIVSYLCLPQLVYAAYTFPYPSYMPGNKFYRISKLIDKLKEWWYWGSLAQIKYHLSLSDKYLVEAKTLFEYKQYLLALDALKRSNLEVTQLQKTVMLAQSGNKSLKEINTKIAEAMLAHVSVLEKLKIDLPADFLWSPEKQAATNLSLTQALDGAIAIRSREKKDNQ